MLNKINYLKSIMKENNKLLEKYKKVLQEISTIELLLENKVNKRTIQINNINNIYIDSIETYSNICKNLLE